MALCVLSKRSCLSVPSLEYFVRAFIYLLSIDLLTLFLSSTLVICQFLLLTRAHILVINLSLCLLVMQISSLVISSVLFFSLLNFEIGFIWSRFWLANSWVD